MTVLMVLVLIVSCVSLGLNLLTFVLVLRRQPDLSLTRRTSRAPAALDPALRDAVRARLRERVQARMAATP